MHDPPLKDRPRESRAAKRVTAYVDLEHALLRRRPRRAAAARRQLERLGVFVEILPESEEART